jgi:hypothetical protein
MKKFVGIFALLMLFALASANFAKADGVDQFTYSAGGNSFTWQLPASPSLPDDEIYPGVAFTIPNVLVSVNGGTPELGSFDFYSTLCSGGFDLTFGDNVPVNTIGQQLYTGWEGAPTFILGTFLETDYGPSDSGIPGKLVIATPEPSALLSLAAGFVFLLLALSSRKIIGRPVQS